MRTIALLSVLATLAGLGCGSSTNDSLDGSPGPGLDAASDGGASRDAGPRGPGPCVGVRPDPSAWLAEPGPRREPQPDGGAGGDAGAGCAPATCLGATAPTWALRDFQPQSCGSDATYGLEVFRGKVTVVALLAAW